MRFIGGKSLLLDELSSIIRTYAPDAKSFIDIFAGSGVVSERFKSEGYEVISNDFLYFSSVMIKGKLELNKRPSFKNLGILDPISYLNGIDINKLDKTTCFIYQNYAPHGTCERMYFTVDNALKIDGIRQTIELWKNERKITSKEYYYLLSSLISAVPFVANVAGVYAAYLKSWDPRALKPIILQEPELIRSKKRFRTLNLNCMKVIREIKADVLYSDSPYNQREYLPNYHVLETIARYDYPIITGKTGLRDYTEQKSDFCRPKKVASAFENMIRNAQVKYVMISYNSEGILSTDELKQICMKYAKEGTFVFKEIPYRRYKSKIPNNEKGLMEQIYFFEKNEKKLIKSPFNYIGGKYRLLNQILPLFPESINSFVDLFVGGGDVLANVNAKHKYANDINYFVIDIFKKFQEIGLDQLLKYIDKIIKNWDLTKENKNSYLAFRDYYNKIRNPIDLYILVCYSFNYQFRFNSNHEFNNPFGKDRSSFNNKMRTNLIDFHKTLYGTTFSSVNFRNFDITKLSAGDFLYADPPYRITTGSYNDGKRGFEGWTLQDDLDLFALLDKVNKQGAKFAMSNVFFHKGIVNYELMEWAKAYYVHHISMDYSNSSYHAKNKDKETDEVLITNY